MLPNITVGETLTPMHITCGKKDTFLSHKNKGTLNVYALQLRGEATSCEPEHPWPMSGWESLQYDLFAFCPSSVPVIAQLCHKCIKWHT